MFVRTKILKDYPVFSTPPIKLWSTQLKGYTGEKIDGYFANENGVTGCTFNPGISSDKVIYQSDSFAEIPGDEVAYFADYEEGETPDQITVVSGAVVLPTKYKGIAFDNTVTGIDGQLYYQYVNGELPESVIPFVGSSFYSNTAIDFPKYSRDEPFNLRTTGMTAGDNYEKNVVLFPVFYSDELNNSITNSKIDILFSLEAPVTVQQGVWRPDNNISRCSPCRINWPPGQRRSYLCYEGTLDVCDGIPYAYFQTRPERVRVLTLNLAICQTEDEKPIVSITDTGYINEFNYQKVLTTGQKNDCFTGEFPESCYDETTITTRVCGTFSSRDVWPICDPLFGLNRGYSREFESCSKLPLKPCESSGPCDGVNCEAACPEKTYTVVYKYTESIQECFLPELGCPRYYRKEVGGLPLLYEIFDMGNPTQVAAYQAYTANCGQEEFPCVDLCLGCRTTRCKEYTLTVPGCSATPTSVKIDIVSTSEGTVDVFTCEGYEIIDNSSDFNVVVEIDSPCPNALSRNNNLDCDCCCFVDRNGNPIPKCDEQTSNINLAFIKLKDTTDYKPNPFLIYHTNPAYSYVLNGKTTFNFAQYIDNYFKTFATYAQPLFSPAVIVGYKSLFKNPLCSNDYPEYFFANIEQEKVGITTGYNPEVCAYTYNEFPNPVTACEDLFKLRRRTPSRVSCSLNVKHYKLEDYSFKLACDEQTNPEAYNDNTQWSKLKKWPMERIEYYGVCEGEGVTLSIQMPTGLTLNDCTNILSWDFLKNAPK